MFHIPTIFIFYGIAQILHIMCTYYDHKTNIEEHKKHKQNTKKINELEQMIKNFENGSKKKIEEELEKELEKI